MTYKGEEILGLRTSYTTVYRFSLDKKAPCRRVS